MAVKVWRIKGLLKEIKVHHCHTCSPIISLRRVSAFNHGSAGSRAGSPLPPRARVWLPRRGRGARAGAAEGTFCLRLALNKQSNFFLLEKPFCQCVKANQTEALSGAG